jgi:hypothetical protein
MVPKLKALGLVLAAVIAIGAVIASAAQAGTFTAAKYPATLTGTQLSGHSFEFLGTGGTVTCKKTSFHGLLEAAAVTTTITPTYEECTTTGGIEVVVKRTGCDFLFHVGETLAMHKVAGSMDVVCGAGAGIDFEEPATGCVMKITPQEVGGLIYTNHTEAKDFDVDISTVLVYEQNAACPNGEQTNFVKYNGKSTITADHGAESVATMVD